MRNKSKPLVEMSPNELRDAMDELGLRPSFEMLQAARRNEGQDIQIAVVVLKMSDKQLRFVHCVCEYGDGEGIRAMDEFIEEIERIPGLLLNGESIERHVIRVTK